MHVFWSHHWSLWIQPKYNMASIYIPSNLGKLTLVMWATWGWMWLYDCYMASHNARIHFVVTVTLLHCDPILRTPSK